MKKFYDILLSVKTAFWLMVAFSVIAIIGSVIHPRNLSFFSGIDSTPLFKWLIHSDHLEITWWIYGMILVLALLGINTLVCTVDALIRKVRLKNLMLKLSPQLIHIGVMMIMIGHLLTASLGLKMDLFLEKGKTARITGNRIVGLNDVEVVMNEDGYVVDWTTYIWLKTNGKRYNLILKPSRPVYRAGLGFFVQAATRDEEEISSLVRITADPGAPWAFIGGAIVVVGGLMFLLARLRQ